MPLQENKKVFVPFNGMRLVISGIMPAKAVCPSCGAALTIPEAQNNFPFVQAIITCVCTKVIKVMLRK